MSHARAAALASLFAAALLGPGPARAEEPPPTGTHPEVTADDFLARARWLSSPALEGRMSVEPGAFRASQYVADEWARLGLTPAGDDGGWFQPFTIDLPRLAPGNLLEVRAGETTRTAEVEKEWNPVAASPSGEVTAPVVFAGYGVADSDRGYDDYAGLDVTGKVVLVVRREPPRPGGFTERATFRRKLSEAATRHAAALLVVNDGATATGGKDPLLHWSETAGMVPGSATIPFAFVSRAVADALLAPAATTVAALETRIGRDAAAKPASFAVTGASVRLRVAFERRRERNARNVAGILVGADPALRDEVVVVGAHHDHVGRGWFGSAAGPAAQGQIHPGADDNASGTAMLLELAEALAKSKDRPRRSVLFLSFSGEELGLLGSRHYVEHPLRPLAQTVAMVNCDMVGRYDPARTLEVGGVGTAVGLQALVEAAAAPYGLKLSYDPQGVAPSDNTSFFLKKIPVLFFFTGIHAEYHTPRDTADRLNAKDAATIGALVLDVTRTLSDRDDRLAFSQPPAKTRGRAALGIVPSPGSDTGGVVVDSVADGGPAAQAGVRPGDVITAVGPTLVRGLRELQQALAAAKPGDRVVVKVLRGGAEQSVEVTLGSR